MKIITIKKSREHRSELPKILENQEKWTIENKSQKI